MTTRLAPAGHSMGEREEPVKGSRIITTAIAIGLIAGSSLATIAQDEAEPTATYATGSMSWPPAEIVPPEVEESAGGNDERGLQLIDLAVEFDDPRLSGQLTTHGNGTTRLLADGRAWIESRAHRLVNEDGAWAGSGTLVRALGDETGLEVDREEMLLTGEGAYEGLIAYIYADPDDGAAPLKALILEASPPPAPDPVE